MLESRPGWLTLLLWVSAAMFVGLAVGPALLLLMLALQPPGSDMMSLRWNPTLENFRGAWQQGELARPLLNSVLVTIGRTILNVLLAALAAYPLARMRFRGRSITLVLILATMMIPDQVVLVPMFRTVVRMGLADTLLAVIIPFSVSALGIFMCKQAFEQIPASLEEAARMDGATAPQVWWHIMLPLAAPTLATLALFSMIGAWSELLWPLVVLQSQHNQTLPVAVNQLLGEFATNTRLAYAGALLSLVPIVATFVVCQRWLKPHMFAGAVKG